MLDGIEDANGPVAADAVLAFTRRVCNWRPSRSDDFRSPIVRGMARIKPQARARKRILTDDELRDVWTALAVAIVPACYPRFIRFLLLTATRRNEAADMHKHELEADAIWTILGERYKTKLDHVVPLSAAAQQLIGPSRCARWLRLQHLGRRRALPQPRRGQARTRQDHRSDTRCRRPTADGAMAIA